MDKAKTPPPIETDQSLRFRARVLETVGEAVLATDGADRISYANRRAQRLFGRPLEDLRTVCMLDLFAGETRERMGNALERVKRGADWSGEVIAQRRDGTPFEVRITCAPILDDDGVIVGQASVCIELTGFKRCEDEVLRLQKLESIGTLAGGIAHDFNNLLTAVAGNIALAKMDLSAESHAHHALSEAEKVFWRAKDLTQQLITFARGGAPIRRTARLDDVLHNSVQLALAGAHVRCEPDIADDLWAASFDAGQIHHALTNVINNAKEAMPAGGVIEFRAFNVALRADECYPLPAGRYVCMEIRDHGMGIPQHHLARIFDPYFTTKQRGGGLGLATAYSIIRKHDGYVRVESELGQGTRLRLYLPAAVLAAPPLGPRAAKTGKILVMDDDENIRRVSASLLAALGYEAVFASDGNEALQFYREALSAGVRFDAVILDLTVPMGMGGLECLDHLKALDPEVRALVSSGYSSDPVMAEYVNYGFAGRIPKPYQLDELSDALRQVLG